MNRNLMNCALPLLIIAAASPAFAQNCGLCAKRVVVVPTTAPCLSSALKGAEHSAVDFITFDLSKCGTVTELRGVVPGLPSPEDLSKRPTIRFVVPRDKLACLRERFVAAQAALDPFAVIDLAACP